jgi:multiple sugar transport system substrate-binding protein
MRRLITVFLCIGVLALGFQVSAQERSEVSVFFHTGSGAENDAIQAILNSFNEVQDQYEAVITELPGDGYNEQVTAAALSGTLPCVLDFDGPYQYNYAWSGYMRPLNDLATEEYLADFLPSIIEQGTYNGQLYSLGAFEGGLALWGNRSKLEAAGVRIPTSADDAWTLDEFNAALEALKAADPDNYPLDLKMNYGAGEWFTFGFSPILQSFGGDLIDREEFQTSEGILNGEESVAAMEWFQSLFTNGYANASPPDDNEFVNGNAALSFVGHWEYGRYAQELGEELVLIPMPDFGNGPKTGTGSWAWAITPNCDNIEGAWALMQHILSPENVALITEANGAIPARVSVLEQDERFAEGGPLRIYYEQFMAGSGVPRPQTPAYSVITAAFASAVAEIAAGSDVQESLDTAVDRIEADIEANNGYQPAS